MRVLIPVAGLVAPVDALAHGAGEAASWTFEPWVVALLLAAAAAYAIGLARLWRRAGMGGGISVGRASAFWTGWLLLALALCSPLDAVAAQLFSAHMVQHEILMVAAAPLFVLGRPLAVWTWGVARSARGDATRWTRGARMRGAWRAVTHPLSAFSIHTAALWLWHVPALFDAAMRNEAVHALQHASFLFSALLFWWAICGRTRAPLRDGVAVLYLFATMLHTGALGALLTLSPTPWYAVDPRRTAGWDLTLGEDQQLGGLIMWIPAGTVYVAAALYLMARWLTTAGAPSPEPLPRGGAQ